MLNVFWRVHLCLWMHVESVIVREMKPEPARLNDGFVSDCKVCAENYQALFCVCVDTEGGHLLRRRYFFIHHRT